MSSVTSAIISSAAQAGVQSREVSASRTADRKSQETGGTRTGPGVNETGEIVTTSDNDTQIFADAEGLGSQGRQTEEESQGNSDEAGENSSALKSAGLHQDKDGHWHVDVEA